MYSERRSIILRGLPIRSGARHRGTEEGPALLRQIGLSDMLAMAGFAVEDGGNVSPQTSRGLSDNPDPQEAARDVAAFTQAAISCIGDDDDLDRLPIYLGGDHAMSFGTVLGEAVRAHRAGQPLFVLWLDAHADFNTRFTSPSGNLHGMPAAGFCGLPGFDDILGDEVRHFVDPDRVRQIGIRSVDQAERPLLAREGVDVVEMTDLSRYGVDAALRPFLHRVQQQNGRLHVSFDVDFLDPVVAPAVGTPVDDGASFEQARRIMEMVRASGLVTSIDIAELNACLPKARETAETTADLVSLMLGASASDQQQRSA